MRRWLIAVIALAIVGMVIVPSALRLLGQAAPIQVGILHSQTGPMKISERR